MEGPKDRGESDGQISGEILESEKDNSEFAMKLEVAERVIEKYGEAMRKLADS
jgi:hypothetical protein